MKVTRQGLATLMLQQSASLSITYIQQCGPAMFTLLVNGHEHLALVLCKSSDYWQKRVHLSKTRFTLLIAWEHDSCVPLDVLTLKGGMWYAPYAISRAVERRTRRTSPTLLGLLMCGDQHAYDLLNDESRTHPSVKYRYLAKVHALARRCRGRPIAS